MEALRPIVESDARPVEKLRQAIRAHVRVVTGDLAAATVYFHEWKALQGERRERFLAYRREYEGLLRRVVEEGMATGALNPQADPKFATVLILSAVNWLYQWYRPDGPLSPDEIAERFGHLILSGIGAGAEKVLAIHQLT
ncbi:MAG: TetR/AcrR family transcriptional regulator C-terminal domain-containing protein [Ardenticatenia bacterium]|nr:TetR/AcrR family transcriptional regulator C-terminal domain-containing protein [Ardenticatenia bacterium]